MRSLPCCLGFLVVAGSLLLGRSALADPVLYVTPTQLARDEPPREEPRAETTDYLFPRAGGFSASIASGVPLLGIGELAYGVTGGFAVGAVVAGTPDMGNLKGTAAIGIRPRGTLFDDGNWRASLVVPILYYPQLKGFGDREPWMLVRPTLSVERRLDSGVRVSAGVGMIGTACMESILTLGKEHDMMGGVWNTVSVGAAMPLGAGTSLFGDATLVMNGVVPARDWPGGPPVIAIVGLAKNL
jgi:hypothetical protein